jgi:F0F1-type ATP synthase assembly protein I
MVKRKKLCLKTIIFVLVVRIVASLWQWQFYLSGYTGGACFIDIIGMKNHPVYWGKQL